MLLNGIVDLINFLIVGLGAILNFIFSVLPNSPFVAINKSPIAPYLNGINYFIPIGAMINIGFAFLSCYGLYLVYQIVLRWIKAVGQ